MLIEGAMADWSGVFMTTVAAAPVSVGSAAYAAFSIAMVLGRLAGDAVVRRLGAAAALRLGGGLSLCGLALALGAATPVASAVGVATVGLGVSNVIPVLFSAAARARPDAPGMGVSQAATIGYTGFLIGPPIIGALADQVGLRGALLVLPLAALVIVIRAGWAGRRG